MSTAATWNQNNPLSQEVEKRLQSHGPTSFEHLLTLAPFFLKFHRSLASKSSRSSASLSSFTFPTLSSSIFNFSRPRPRPFIPLPISLTPLNSFPLTFSSFNSRSDLLSTTTTQRIKFIRTFLESRQRSFSALSWNGS